MATLKVIDPLFETANIPQAELFLRLSLRCFCTVRSKRPTAASAREADPAPLARRAYFFFQIGLGCVLSASSCTALDALFGVSSAPPAGTVRVYRIVTDDPPDIRSSIQLPQTLADGLGMQWTIQPNGRLTDASDRSGSPADFMNFEFLVPAFLLRQFDPGTSDAAIEDGREFVVGPIPIDGGLTLTRKVFVSSTRGFARWLDIIANPTTEDVPIQARNFGTLGLSSTDDRVALSSNGDATLESGDVWWISQGTGPAASLFLGAFTAGVRSSDKRLDEVSLDYGSRQIVPALGRRILATFLFKRTARAADSDSESLETPLRELERLPHSDPAFLEGMTAEEVNDLRDFGGNVAVSGDPGSMRPNDVITIRNSANGDTRTAIARADGGFGPVNVTGRDGDAIRITTFVSSLTLLVP